MNAARVFILQTWHPTIGATIFPVGVLGLAPDGGWHASWVPLTYHRARGWHARLRDGVNEERIAAWLGESGTEQLTELTPPTGALSLQDAVEIAMDRVLAGLET